LGPARYTELIRVTVVVFNSLLERFYYNMMLNLRFRVSIARVQNNNTKYAVIRSNNIIMIALDDLDCDRIIWSRAVRTAWSIRDSPGFLLLTVVTMNCSRHPSLAS
jgi:hypothetical protein